MTDPARSISRSARGLLLLTAASLLLVACSGPAPLPDFRYYRLAPPTRVEALGQPALDAPLVLNAVQADGVHGERPILYATDPDSLRIAQYHYQLWNDPPPALVLRRALHLFEQRNLAPLVTERLDPRISAYRLSTRLFRFEVIREGVNREAVIGMRLRLDRDGESYPVLEKRIELRQEATGERLEEGTRVLSELLDRALMQFAAEVERTVAARPAPAGAD
ncbi:MAG: membrane integrity-associated transporter subunit PqiC [Xanthomonadales bacterium]|nr:membrane integrity-associated transporter subunit PqiC [Xanthomonadales bacterium]